MRYQYQRGIGIMARATACLAAACGAIVLSGSAATAQVVFGLPTVTGAPGAEVDFAFTATGASAADVTNGQFLVACDPTTSEFEPVTEADGVTITSCTVASSLATLGFVTDAQWLKDSGVVSITVRDGTSPFVGYGGEGVITTCKFKIKATAETGEVSIPCAEISPLASNPAGQDVPASCTGGALTVGPKPPTPTGTTGSSPTPTATPTPSQYGGCSYSGEFTLPATNATAETDVTVALACSFDGKITGTETLVANAATTTLTCAGDCDTDNGELSNVECAEEGGGGPFAGCYHGEFSITSPVPTDIITDLECGNSGTITGEVQIVALAATVTCTGSCDTQTGVLSTVVCPTTTGGDLTISGTLPQPVGETANLTYVHSLLGTLNQPVENVACGAGSAISSEISGTLPREGETGPLTFTLAGASTEQDVSNTECLAPPTPTGTKGPTGTPTTGGPVYTTKISESGCNITPNGGSGTPWTLIIPAAALLVLRRRRG